MARVKRGKKGGRPKWVPGDAELAEISKLAALQCTQEEIAAWFGIGLATLKRRAAEMPELREILDHGREKGRISFRRLLWRHAETGNSKALGLLASRFGWDEKYRHEHTGKDGGAIVTEKRSGLSEEAADTIRREILGLGQRDDEDVAPEGETVH